MAISKKEIHRLITRIADLTYRINSEPTRQDCTANKPTIFFKLSGHIAGLEVMIFPKGWESGNCESSEYYICYNWTREDELEQVYRALRRLEAIYQEWGDTNEEGIDNE